MRKILTFMLMLALTACGGGGSGGDNETGLSVSFSTSTLNFSYIENDIPASQTMYATASGDTDKDVLLSAEVTGSGIATPIQVAIDMATRRATITVTAASMPAGTYTGTIVMKACGNQSCTVQHRGSPHTVNYTVTVHPSLNVNAQTVNLATPETGVSEIRSITFNPALANAGVIATHGSDSEWLTATVSGNTLQLQANAGTKMPFIYATYVNLKVPATGQVASILVQMAVNSGLSVPAGTELTVNSSSTAQDLQGDIPVALAPGVSAATWYATSDAPWLVLDMASGPFGTNPTWRIDPALFAQRANNQRHLANVRITTDSTLQPRTFAVDANKALAEIKGTDTVALIEGEGGEVMLYGANFRSLPASTDSVTVNGAGVAAASLSVISDSVMRISMPALQAGGYTVVLNSASGMPTRSGTLTVTGRATYGYQAIDTQGVKNMVVWDPVSQSAFVVNGSLNSVMRFAPAGGQFQLVATRSFPLIDAIGMNRDHTALGLMTGSGTFYRLRPQDLVPTTYSGIGQNLSGEGRTQSVPLSIMGNSNLMHPTLGWFDVEAGSLSPMAYADTGTNTFGLATWGAVSGNGRFMIRPANGMFSPSAPMYHMDLADGLFKAYGTGNTPFFYRYTVNHNGSMWGFNNQVFDFQQNLLGNVALPDGWVGNEMVFSRNGSRLYYYAQNAGISAGTRVYVFDTSQPMTTSVNYPVLGHIDLADMPNCPYDPSGNAQDCYTFNTRMAIADDGQTLFLAGDRKFLVVPIPSSLQSVAMAQSAVMSGQTRMPRLR